MYISFVIVLVQGFLGFTMYLLYRTLDQAYIFFYLYMIIQNTQYTDYSLYFSVLPSLNLTNTITMLKSEESLVGSLYWSSRFETE